MSFATQIEEDRKKGAPLKDRIASGSLRNALPPTRLSSRGLLAVQKVRSWLARGWTWRWAWLITGALVSLKSFFVRQLLSAFVLFTAVFAIAGALILLFIGIDYAADSAISWVESELRLIHFPAHHSVAVTARFSIRKTDGGVRRFNGFDRN